MLGSEEIIEAGTASDKEAQLLPTRQLQLLARIAHLEPENSSIQFGLRPELVPWVKPDKIRGVANMCAVSEVFYQADVILLPATRSASVHQVSTPQVGSGSVRSSVVPLVFCGANCAGSDSADRKEVTIGSRARSRIRVNYSRARAGRRGSRRTTRTQRESVSTERLKSLTHYPQRKR